MKKYLRPINAATEEATNFQIPITWQLQANVTVTAKSLKEAVQIINKREYELPEGNYVEGSFEIDFDRLES